VSILALGLSASIAVFTYINGFYQPFPGVEGRGLVRMYGVTEEDAFQEIPYLDFLDYKEGAGRSFEQIAAVQPFYAASVRLENMTEVAFLEAVSGDFFSVLGIETAIGRGIVSEDDRPGAEPVAVISYDWWQRSFNADPAVIGTTIYLNYRPFIVAGVASPEFLGSAASFRPDVWIPIAPFKDRYTRWAQFAENRDIPLVRVYGRLRSGTGDEQAVAELATLALGLDEAYPREDSRRVRLGAPTWIDPRARLAEWPTVRLMMATAAGLLLLVCANVANLLLAVATGRQQELSMRAALGASPGRLVRQVMIENVTLSVLAGAVALALASPLSVRLGSYFARPSVWGANVSREAAIDLEVVLFALGISVITGVLAGLLPAIRASRRDLVSTLRPDAVGRRPRRMLGKRTPGVHNTLVTTQVALSIVLLVVAGLVLRTLASVVSLDPGFAYDQLVVTHVSTSSTNLEVEERDHFFRDMPARLAEEPWVNSATVADYPLLSPHMSADLQLEGQDDPTALVYSRVIPGFFEALGIDVVQGRGFEAYDTIGSTDVAMINQALATRFFPGDHPIGRRIWWTQADESVREFEIVGIVRDTKTQDFMSEPEATVYFAYPQFRYPTGSALILATNIDPGASIPSLYRWLRDYEPHLAIVNVIPYRRVVSGILYTQRMNAEMFSALAFLGLVLAAVGIFSVMSLAVSRRTREIGIRTAIGAQRTDIGRLVVAQAMVPVGVGLLIGLGASFAAAGLVRGLLFGVEPTDPTTLFAGSLVLIVAALVAAYLPARRAASVDPIIALRQE
jgi:predicted permease